MLHQPLSRSRRRNTRLRAFTLLEILVVLAIIGLLVGLAVTKLGGILGSSQSDTARIFVTTSLKTPITAYRIDVGDYPSTAEGLDALIVAPTGKAERWRGPYLDVTGNKAPLDPWKNPYVYRYPGTQNKGGYDVFSKGPNGVEGDADDINNW